MWCEPFCTAATDGPGSAPTIDMPPEPLPELREAPRQEAFGMPRSCEIALPLKRLGAARLVFSDGLFGELG